MNVIPGKLADTLVFEPEIFQDARGAFFEVWQQERYRDAGLAYDFVQDMHSVSARDILRGLHYQIRNPQGHLVTVLRGWVYDVGLDLRQSSPTFGEWMGLELDGDRRQQVWLPPGIAHGFCVLSDEAEISYKCTDFYAPGDEGGVRWDDLDLAISWPSKNPLVTSRDAGFPPLRDITPDMLPQV